MPLLDLACAESAGFPCVLQTLRNVWKTLTEATKISSYNNHFLQSLGYKPFKSDYGHRQDLFAVRKVTPSHALLSFIPAGFLSSGVDLTAPSKLLLPALPNAAAEGAEGQASMRLPPFVALLFFLSPHGLLSSSCAFSDFGQIVLPLVIRALSHVTVIRLFSSQLTPPLLSTVFPPIEYQSSSVYIRDRLICQDPRIKHLGWMPEKWCSHWISTSFYNYF